MLHMATVAKRGSKWRPAQPGLYQNPDALFIGDDVTETIMGTNYQLQRLMLSLWARKGQNGTKISIFILDLTIILTFSKPFLTDFNK